MIPDTKIKDYYLSFIYNAKSDINKYEDELDEIQLLKDITYKYINDYINEIEECFGITFEQYKKELIDKEYNTTEHLYNAIIKLLRIDETHPKRVHLLQLVKYCNILRQEYKLIKKIKFASKRKDMPLKEYKKYVFSYYTKVHECVLKGMGYTFGYDIGTYVINHWKLDSNKMLKRPKLDYAATNAKKKELIAKGVKLYDQKEADWYAARHIPYTGVDYRVYQQNNDWYEFVFINSGLSKKYLLEYQRTEYVASKLRGMSYTEMADKLCKTEYDIYNLQVDIKYKLNILLYKDPTKYLNFVRNAEQCKYKRGAHNR